MLITALSPTVNRPRPTFQPQVREALDRYTPSAEPEFKPYGPFLKVGKAPANAGAALGTGDLRDEMTKAGMKDVGSPPSEAELRTYYSQHAPHHDLIAAKKYAEAAAAYRDDAVKAGGKAEAKALNRRAAQLEYAAGMGKRSFPPTFKEVKKHFEGFQSKPAADVNTQFQNYASAFYEHVQKTDRKADIVYDQDGKAKVDTFTPEDYADVSDSRGLNRNGQRLIDCEGYAYLGKELFGAAGYQQPEDGGFMVMRGKDDEAHVILHMQRGKNDKVWVSNSRATDDLVEAYDSTRDALGLPSKTKASFYHGSTEQQAVVRATLQQGTRTDVEFR